MKTVPFWIDDHPGRTYQRPDELPSRVDVAVVGAGYTGLACALGIARAGGSVVVVDKGAVGAGASSVNGGQLCPGLKKSPQQLFDLYGQELGRELWDASVEAVHAVERLIEEESIDCAYEATGGLSLAYKPHHFERQQRYAEWLEREIGYEREAIPKERIRDEIGSDLYHGGLLDRRGGGLHPARFVHGLAEAAERHEAQIVEHAEVVDIRDAEGRHRLTLDTAETFDADEVLVATNGYTDGLVPGLRRRVLPIGSYIITTEPLPDAVQAELAPNRRMFFDSRWFLNYYRLTPDGRVAIGGRNDLSTDLSLEESAVNLRQSLLAIYPQLDQAEITHTWTGRLGFSFDLIPHIGRLGGVRYAMGFSGHGVGLSAYLGLDVARMILGQGEASPFARVKHPTSVFYWNKPWFLPIAAWWYRLRDRWT